MAIVPLDSRRTAKESDGRSFARGCADFFDEAGRLFGLPPSVGRIYGLLYGSTEPLSFTDIVEQLGISKGSASQGIQFLRDLGGIKVAAPAEHPGRSRHRADLEGEGPRRDYYEPELSLRGLVSGVLKDRISPLAMAGSDRLERLRELAGASGAARDFNLDRVRRLETWRRRLKAVLPVLSMLLGPKLRK